MGERFATSLPLILEIGQGVGSEYGESDAESQIAENLVAAAEGGTLEIRGKKNQSRCKSDN